MKHVATINRDGIDIKIEWDAEEQEYQASHRGFAATGRTQEKAVSLLIAYRKDCLLADDDDEES